MKSKKLKQLKSFYHFAASLYYRVAQKQSTITSLALDEHTRQKKKCYALLNQCHKNISLIKCIVENSHLLDVRNTKTITKKVALIYLLVHDYLWNQELQVSSEKMGQFLLAFPIISKCKTRLHAEWVRLSIAGNEYKKVSKNNEEVKTKYARFNMLLSSASELASLVEELKESLNDCGSIFWDDLIPNLLCFKDIPSNFEFHKLSLVKKGKLIVQVRDFTYCKDKASCLPAIVLSPIQGSVVLDACAAPGNKTTHLAAILENKGSIIALEQNVKRYKLLEKNLSLSGADASTVPYCCDFLSVDTFKSPFSKVEYILLDPSCSGSWMSSRELDGWDSSKFSDSQLNERIEKLAKFQELALEKAMSFPNVKRIVYSTCSITERENEMVVQNVLNRNEQFILADLPPFLETWTRRGTDYLLPGLLNLLIVELRSKVLRLDPFKDGCHGFFIASFEKLAPQIN